MPPDSRLAIVVNPDLPLGLLANTVGAIGIGLGARLPWLGNRPLTDADGRTIDDSSVLPVPILAAAPEAIQALMLKAMPRGDDSALVGVPGLLAVAARLPRVRGAAARKAACRRSDRRCRPVRSGQVGEIAHRLVASSSVIAVSGMAGSETVSHEDRSARGARPPW